MPASAVYGLSVQAASISAGLAFVWVVVKWPLIGQFVARREVTPLRRTFCPRLLLLLGTLVLLLVGMMALGPFLLGVIGSKTTLLPTVWLALLAANTLLEGHCSAWNTLIAFGNRLPMLWPSLATNAVSLALNLALAHCASAQAGWLALGPLLAGLAFNYWYWPRAGARTLQLSWPEAFSYGFRSRPEFHPTHYPWTNSSLPLVNNSGVLMPGIATSGFKPKLRNFPPAVGCSTPAPVPANTARSSATAATRPKIFASTKVRW